MRHFSLRLQNSEYPRIFQVMGANQNAQKSLFTDLLNASPEYYSRLRQCMLQVIFFLRSIRFQTRLICFNLGQFVLNLDQFGAHKKHSSQATSHRSLFYQYRNNHNCVQMLTLGLKPCDLWPVTCVFYLPLTFHFPYRQPSPITVL